MLPEKFNSVIFLFVFEIIMINCNSLHCSNKTSRHRQKRTVYFTYYGGYTLDVVLSLPLELPANNIAFNSFLFSTNFFFPSFDNTNGLIPLPFAYILEPGVNAGSKNRIELPPAYRQFNDDSDEKSFVSNNKNFEKNEIFDKNARYTNLSDTLHIDERKSSNKQRKLKKTTNKSRKARSPLSNYFMSRRRFYKMMESKMNSSGLEGHDCLLKAICETSESSFGHQNGVIGSVVDILFLPSTSKDEKLPKRYYNAEANGKYGGCTVYNTACPKSVFDYVSKII